MFGKIKNWFSKEEEPLDNPTVLQMDKGFVFDYDLKTWTVMEVFEYDWGNEHFSVEFQVTDGIDTRFLSVEQDDELEITFQQKKKIHQISSVLKKQLEENDQPPQEFVFQGEVYTKIGEFPGYMNAQSKGEKVWEEFISWTYENQDSDKIISVEQWGEHEFEAAVGVYVKPHQISNILPA